MPANESIPIYDAGRRITGQTSAAVTGKRFVMISGNRTSGPGLSSTSEGGNVVVAHATAAGRVFGVAAHDAASGEKVPVLRGAGLVLPVTAASNLTAFQEVEVGANGQATAKSAGVAVGYAINACASGADAEISLY
jgi:predicted RecA/RadA family phage recombinase